MYGAVDGALGVVLVWMVLALCCAVPCCAGPGKGSCCGACRAMGVCDLGRIVPGAVHSDPYLHLYPEG